MSFVRKHSRLLLIAVSCATLGAAASAIAAAGAATSSPSNPAKARPHARDRRAGGLRRVALRSVHGDLVVKTKTGFGTVTFDRGKVDSVSGQQLTMTDATRNASYKTITLTIPSGAVIRDDRKPAALSDLKAGQRVIVVQAPKRTFVVAHTPKHP
jgi:hypothetical protein